MKAVPPALFAIFQAEHAEHLEQIRSIVALAEKLGEGAGPEQLEEAFRRAHSLKGAARAVDLPQVEGLAHHLETLFSRVRDGSLRLDSNAASVIHQVLDSNEDCLTALRENRTPAQPGAALLAIETLLGLPAGAGADEPAPRGAQLPAPEQDLTQKPVEMVRLPAHELDRVVRAAGRILLESRRQKRVTEDLLALTRQVTATEAQWTLVSKMPSAATLARPAARGQHRPTASSHAAAMHQQVHSLAALARTVRMRQGRAAWSLSGAAEQLQRDVWNARMAPADDLYQSFRRMVRDLARDENKEIHFQVQGSGVRADRMVLQALKDPVMHLLRNAISHGIELPGEREHQGKPGAASLTLHLSSRRGRLFVAVDDDGRGVDFDRVAAVARQRGLIPPATDQQPAPQDLAPLLFQPGFSTAPEVNALSGRGMGLSVVYEAVRRLQGNVEVRPKPGPGTAIELSVPLSISTLHLILVACAGQTFGVPTHGIERLCRLPLGQVERVEGKPVARVEGRPVPIFSLARILQLDMATASFAGDFLPVMLLRLGRQVVGLLVDQFVGQENALIQELGMPCPAHGNISGGAILGEGSVVVVLNPAGLVESCTPDAERPSFQSSKPPPLALAPSILVVDDSITTRSLEKSILEAHGYRVRVATDGLEALQLLRESPADMIITDIQMPRLDGFGLLEAVKADAKLCHIPVIIVSSLERVEDQRRGLQLGADAYVTKGRFDQGELLSAIRQIL